jgi:hypothetical protein
MSRKRSQIGSGAIACVLWSAIVGWPVLSIHLYGGTLGPGDHVHAGILFIASNLLLFWLFGRSRSSVVSARSSRKSIADSAATATIDHEAVG